MKDVLSTKTVKRNEVLRHMQLDRRKKIYKAIKDNILSLKNVLDVSDEEEKKLVIKEIKKLSKIQNYFLDKNQD